MGEGSWGRGQRQRTDRGGRGQTEEGEEGQVQSSDGMPRKTVSRHMGHL